jgi:PAS domain S-box-containing protein
VVDAFGGAPALLIAFQLVFPLIAATRVSARGTAVVGAYCFALAIALGIPSDIFGDERHVVAVLIVAASGVLAVWIASLRSQREVTAARLAAQNEVARALAEAPSLSAAGIRILEAIARTLGWEYGALWEPRRPGVLRCVETWSAPGRDAESFVRLSREMSFAPGVGLPGRIWASGEPAWIPNVLEDENFPRAPGAVEVGFQGAVGFPIRISGGVRGVIEFFATDVRKPDAELLAFMSAVGNQIGETIERRRAEAAIRESEARKAAMLESALDGVITIDHLGRVVEFNPAAEAIFGYRREDTLGKEMASLIIPPSLRARHREALGRVVETGEGRILDQRIELTGMRADGSEFPVELAITQIRGEPPPIFTGYVRDITERKRAEEQRARAERAQRFLSESSRVLAATLNYSVTLERVAQLAVPEIADWCAVDLHTDEGSIERVTFAHTDPARLERAEELMRRYPPDPRSPIGVPNVIRTGAPELYREIPEELLAGTAHDATHVELLREFGFRSAMVVPMTARGRTLGAITFVSGESGRRFDEEDLRLAEEVGRRAAIAIDNARAFGERTYIARTLQRSLLPPKLPEIPGVEAAARFHAAGEGYEVGGDFYDVFETGDARWTVVIGDVCGKGTDAAAVTALARYTLRATAMRESRPSRILGLLNEALLRQRSDMRFCTVAYGQLEQGPSGVHVETSIGGHPLPMLVRAGGDIQRAGEHGTLLGVVSDPHLHDQRVELQPGDALVFYTDGVSEARGPGGVLGEERLESVVAASAGLGADEIAKRVEAAAVDVYAGEPRDDIAVVVLRVSR